MPAALITGGSGFFGRILIRRLLVDGWNCVNIDLIPGEAEAPDLRWIQGDIRDGELVRRLFSEHDFDAVFHCAAVLGHSVVNGKILWDSNVTASHVLADLAAAHGVSSFVFISSNCLWGRSLGRPVLENDLPDPVDLYGSSKWAAEQAVAAYSDRMATVVLRVPTIIDAGRLGLLAILFEFIAEGRRVWTVGAGDNRYQFVFAPDLADACVRAVVRADSGTFNIGSDNVQALRDVYQSVIDWAGTEARLGHLPVRITRLAMRVANKLRISPLGPYHWRMISEDFEFDTTKAKRVLGWQPTLDNAEMLRRAYEAYLCLRSAPESQTPLSAHRKVAHMGVIRLLKWIS